MKKILIVWGIIAVFLLGIVFLKDQIIKFVVTRVATQVVGAPVHMDSFSLNIFSSTVHISGFKIYNPSGFPQGILVSCSKINVIYDHVSLFKQKPHVLILEIDLKEMGLIKNKEGKLNVDSLIIVEKPKSSAPAPMQIDLLTLSIGKIVYKDYTVGTEPNVRVYDINKHKSYKGVPSAQQLALLVLAEPMKAAAIKNAQIYGVAILAGVAILPVAVAATFIGNDSVQDSLDINFEHAYEVSLQVLKRMGTVSKQDAANGEIIANINGAAITLKLKTSSDHKTIIIISARKYMMPKLDIAGGVLYQVLDKLQ